MNTTNYSSSLEKLVQLAIAEDFGEIGDATSKAIFDDTAKIEGYIVAKQAGVIAGLDTLVKTYAAIDPRVSVSLKSQDGDHVEVGTVIADISGPAIAILSGERIALNFLQHLSGVASLTSQFVAAVAGTQAVILDTRKTTPGWRILEKHAVKMGGGQNHRMGLYDMVLIKDNHIDAAGSMTKAVEKVRASSVAKNLAVVVEARTMAEVREGLAVHAERILLDNMTTQEMREAVQLINHQSEIEASGNMSLERLKEVAQNGVDFISVGKLTNSAPVLDLSMKLKNV